MQSGLQVAMLDVADRSKGAMSERLTFPLFLTILPPLSREGLP